MAEFKKVRIHWQGDRPELIQGQPTEDFEEAAQSAFDEAAREGLDIPDSSYDLFFDKDGVTFFRGEKKES